MIDILFITPYIEVLLLQRTSLPRNPVMQPCHQGCQKDTDDPGPRPRGGPCKGHTEVYDWPLNGIKYDNLLTELYHWQYNLDVFTLNICWKHISTCHLIAHLLLIVKMVLWKHLASQMCRTDVPQTNKLSQNAESQTISSSICFSLLFCVKIKGGI